MTLTTQILSSIPGNYLERLRRVDQLWENLKQDNLANPQVVLTSSQSLEEVNSDVIISGGTLGILLAAALQKQGQQVILMEKGILRGRDQEWNISRRELEVFLELDLLNQEELEKAIATEYNPARVSFGTAQDIMIKDVLNIGIDPVFLLETLKNKFLDFGGTLLEETPFNAATIHPNGVLVEGGEHRLTTRLLIDAMGHFSPIAQQARQGEQPQGVCLVVGSCAEGYPQNDQGDLIVSFTPIQNQCQYFWEAFPAREGRTTYMFTYLDAHPERPSLEFFMEEYLRLLPTYQQVELDQLQFKRFLYGFFPSYRNSPLDLPWNRILAVGDSSGSQSPVSFGGFGAMVRHLSRLSIGINEALNNNLLNRQALSWLQPYQPNISVTWLFQRTMSVGINQEMQEHQINDLMNGVFTVMDKLGEDVLKPFLQDVISFMPLAKTLPLVKPGLVLPIIPVVGIGNLIDWSIHYFNLALYSGLYPLGEFLSPLAEKLPAQQKYYYHRWLDAWKYGSGADFEL